MTSGVQLIEFLPDAESRKLSVFQTTYEMGNTLGEGELRYSSYCKMDLRAFLSPELTSLCTARMATR